MVRSRYGDPDVNQYTGYANLGMPIGDTGWQMVGWGGYQYRRTQSAAFPRNPSNTNNVPAIYPNGFLPIIQTKSRDLTATGGIKGEIGAWNTSLHRLLRQEHSSTYATLHTLNATYGADSTDAVSMTARCPTTSSSPTLISAMIMRSAAIAT